uniref:trichohyalin-like n=1 Tax=Gasterosteus aculeatus aculeatus TaxID=481459 RepID=UPI001A98CA7B|nr:trichohyalin-like [Gasterosteus aculeatus aculeatus]
MRPWGDLSGERDEQGAQTGGRSRESDHGIQNEETPEAEKVHDNRTLHLQEEVGPLKHEVGGHQDESCPLSQEAGGMQRLMEQKEKQQQRRLRHQLRVGRQQVETFGGKLKKQEVEMEILREQLKGAEEVIRDAGLRAREQKETIAIFRQKYNAAMEKVHRVQGQVELLKEELQYSQQQLRDSQLAAHSAKEELAGMEQRYLEKVGHWENAQEALDQLADELLASRTLLRESQQRADHLKGLVETMREQVDTIKQQKLMLECDRQLHQQSRCDEQWHREQLHKRCTEQVVRLAECEKAILQMKSELERQVRREADRRQSSVASRRANMSDRIQLEQEVIHLKKEVAAVRREPADTQKVHMALGRQSEEQLKEVRRAAARRSGDGFAHREEVQRLQEDLLKAEERMRRQLSRELEEPRSEPQVTAEELATRAEEARRMQGRLNEGKLAEEKIRSRDGGPETEVAALRRNLQHAVDHKLQAEREKREAREQVDTLLAELEETRSEKANLRHESQLVVTNVNCWIAKQKASNESLSGRTEAQNKVLLILTEEKAHLQGSNDALKAEVTRLKEVGDEKTRDTERFQAWTRASRKTGERKFTSNQRLARHATRNPAQTKLTMLITPGVPRCE